MILLLDSKSRFYWITIGLRIDSRRRESDLTLLFIVCTVRRGVYEDKHLFQEEAINLDDRKGKQAVRQ